MEAADTAGGGFKRLAQFITEAGQSRVNLGLRDGKLGHAAGRQIVETRRQLQQCRIAARPYIGKDLRNSGGDIDRHLALRCQKRRKCALEILLPIVESDRHSSSLSPAPGHMLSGK